MELYIPPPSHYLPRLPPPRPQVPTVPVVPAPDLPDVLHAPEGPYNLAKGIFPEVEQPGALPTELGRPGMAMPMGGSSALMGAAGFGMAGPAFIPMPPLSSPNVFAVSAQSTLVNGQWQPAFPTKLVFADVMFPSRAPGKESSFGALIRLGMGKKQVQQENTVQQEAPPLNVYDDEYTSDEASEDDEPTTMAKQHEPLPGATPAAPPPKKGGFGKSGGTKKQDKALSSSRGGIITRVSPNLNLGTIMDDKGKNGAERVRWAFWNMGRLFVWAEEGGASENLATVVFQNPPTTHAISQLTVSPERQDIVVGMESGELVYMDFINDRTERFNVGGKLIKSAVTSIQFDPRGGDRFLVSFANNTLAVYCLFAEDPNEAQLAVITSSPLPWTVMYERAEAEDAAAYAETQRQQLNGEHANGTVNGSTHAPSTNGHSTAHSAPGTVRERRPFLDRLVEWKNDEWNAPASERGKPDKPWAGKNPLAVSHLGSNADIAAMSYSPDGRWLAIVTKDGLLRLLETEEGRVTDVFESYFAALTCVAWSPDSRFVAVGGQDDLVTIYSARESRLVARCQGHTGFVTCIAFDPTMRSEGRGYRFGSVGEDGKLLLWDFSAAALRKPRHHHSNSSHYRVPGAGSSASLTLFGPPEAHYHPAPPKAEVAMLQPVLARVVEGNLMTSLHMGPKTIATVSRAGSIKFWTRPPRQPRSKRRNKDKDGRGGH